MRYNTLSYGSLPYFKRAKPTLETFQASGGQFNDFVTAKRTDGLLGRTHNPHVVNSFLFSLLKKSTRKLGAKYISYTLFDKYLIYLLRNPPHLKLSFVHV